MDQRRSAIVDALFAKANIQADAHLAVCTHSIPSSFRRGFSNAQYYQLSDANNDDDIEEHKVSSTESKTADILSIDDIPVVDEIIDSRRLEEEESADVYHDCENSEIGGDKIDAIIDKDQPTEENAKLSDVETSVTTTEIEV